MNIRAEKKALCRRNRKQNIRNVKVRILCICRYFCYMPLGLGLSPKFLFFSIDLYYVICYLKVLKSFLRA